MEISEAPIAPAASHLPIPSILWPPPTHGTPWPRPFHCLVYLSWWVTSRHDIPRTTGNWELHKNSGKRIQTNWDKVVVVFFLVGIDFCIMVMAITMKILCVPKGLYFQYTSKLIFVLMEPPGISFQMFFLVSVQWRISSIAPPPTQKCQKLQHLKYAFAIFGNRES